MAEKNGNGLKDKILVYALSVFVFLLSMIIGYNFQEHTSLAEGTYRCEESIKELAKIKVDKDDNKRAFDDVHRSIETLRCEQRADIQKINDKLDKIIWKLKVK